jgi:predicted membrane channel-forming protein YqfA (hemolysin III family)
MYGLWLLCAAAVLGASTVAHLLAPVLAPARAKLLWQIDKGAICAAIGGSFVPGITFGFRCRPALRVVYGGTVALLLAVGVASTAACAAARESTVGSRVGGLLDRVRVVSLVLLVAFGLVPLVHWCVAAPTAERLELLPPMLGMFGCFGAGYAFFESRLPERLSPGAFDYTPSHAFWHLAIVAGFGFWDDACGRMLERPWAGPAACVGWA